MNYQKLQLAYIILLVMLTIHLLINLLVLKKIWLTITTLIAIVCCIAGLIYAIKSEEKSGKNKN